MRRTVRLLSLPVAALVVAGCSTESVVENIAEEAAEQATGGEVELDADEGSVTIETEDGSTTLEQTQELPDEFPSDLPVPDDFVISAVQTIEDEETGRSLLVQGEVSDRSGAFELIGDGLEAAGYEVSSRSESVVGGQVVFSGGTVSSGIVGLTGEEDDAVLQYILNFGE